MHQLVSQDSEAIRLGVSSALTACSARVATRARRVENTLSSVANPVSKKTGVNAI